MIRLLRVPNSRKNSHGTLIVVFRANSTPFLFFSSEISSQREWRFCDCGGLDGRWLFRRFHVTDWDRTHWEWECARLHITRYVMVIVVISVKRLYFYPWPKVWTLHCPSAKSSKMWTDLIYKMSSQNLTTNCDNKSEQHFKFYYFVTE